MIRSNEPALTPVTAPGSRLLFVVHAGETVGHVVRAISVAQAARLRGDEVEFASGSRSAGLVRAAGFTVHHLPWRWSHNSASRRGELRPSAAFFDGVKETNQALVALLDSLPAFDLVVGFPGVFTAQAVRHAQQRHAAVLHGPYLSPLVPLDSYTEVERAVLQFGSSYWSGVADPVFNRLSRELGFPEMRYRDWLEHEYIVECDPPVPTGVAANRHRVSFIAGSFGESVPATGQDGSTCLITFGSGHRYDLGAVATVALDHFAHVFVVTGRHRHRLPASKRLTQRRWIASSAVGPVVDVVISHGGIGTVGTFAAYGVKQLVMPTEVDQATLGVHSRRAGIVSTAGLDRWASAPSLGRRAPDLALPDLKAAIGELRSSSASGKVHRSHGAAEAALHLGSYARDDEPAKEIVLT